ncbi:Pheromone-processing carboxypeptidase KEX1 [Meyerozyma sp. JA9]|nr:Pheromone-processing carboxypeptidase KEX1 [Meyerozyma sp. JA9]
MFFQVILVLLQVALAFTASPRAANDARSKYFVSSLPGMYSNLPKDDIPIMYSGQLELFPDNNTHYYFWKFVNPHPIPEAQRRTIFWLNGGPGCSSMDGALMEAGPFRINDDNQIVYNNGSWHKAGDIVFVDQPAGTGFSYSDEYEHELPEVTVHFLKFLEKYFEVFPEDRQNEIFLAGESYAGQYIPYIADGILRRNKNLKTGQSPYDLRGLLIGNGWISPNEQSLSYVQYALQAGFVSPSMPGWSRLLASQEQCQNVVNSVNTKDGSVSDYRVVSDVCDRVLNTLLEVARDRDAPSDQQCVNMYDYTLRDEFPSCGMNWPPDLVNVKPFLNNPGVQSQLNLVYKKPWLECSGRVGRNFIAKRSKPAVHLLPSLLEEVPILLFNGNRDIICNYIGTEAFIKELEWNGQRGWDNENVFDWHFDGNLAGYVRNSRNLTFVNVFNSSHMVPFDVPYTSRSLMDLMTGNFDIKDDKIITYKLGTRGQAKQSDGTPASTSASESSATSFSSGFSSASPQASATADEADKEGNTSHKIERAIQLLVIIVLLWGIYALYSSYKSRPSSIIKSGPTGKKKNVQWADQLRRFQEDDQVRVQPHGIFAKALNKFKGNSDGAYAPVEGRYEDIEMSSASPIDEFVVVSDDEDEEASRNEPSSNHK